MADLIYSMITSLDGYVADAAGGFDWAEPDEAQLEVINRQERAIGTYLYGRRMYEMLAVWETDPSLAAASPANADYAGIWRAADKVVYSTTLTAPITHRTRIESSFDPAGVRALMASATTDVTIAGPTLAAQALSAGLVDRVECFVAPVVVGSGLRFLPDGYGAALTLVDHHRFTNDVVWLSYRIGR